MGFFGSEKRAFFAFLTTFYFIQRMRFVFREGTTNFNWVIVVAASSARGNLKSLFSSPYHERGSWLHPPSISFLETGISFE